MLNMLMSVIPSLFKIGDKMIIDQDKKQEFAFKVQEMIFRQMDALLNAKTYPWVDALVKLAFASENIIKGLFRPIGAALMFVFGVFAEMNQITLSEPIQYMLFGALPAWGVDRGLDKRKKPKDEGW